MRISDGSSDVCSSDLAVIRGASMDPRRRELSLPAVAARRAEPGAWRAHRRQNRDRLSRNARRRAGTVAPCCRKRSEEHTSELQSLMRISYAVFCLKKKKHRKQRRKLNTNHQTNKQ